jgi:hypothetical protein
MSNVAPLTDAEVQKLAKEWYKKLDVHAPLEEFVPMLAEEGLKMVFPEATVEGFEGFKGWYERVIGIFFDEVHTLKKVDVTPKGEQADVKVVVKWEASVWKPPAPKSERIVLDAYQTWVVKRAPQTGKPVVTTYIVDSLDYYEGSAKL